MIIPQAVGKCVCILPDATVDTVSIDGKTKIILTDTSKTTNRKATVINTGSEVKEVKAGDSVYIRMYVSTTNDVKTNDVSDKFYVIHEQEILSKFTQADEATEALVNRVLEANQAAKEAGKAPDQQKESNLIIAR